MLLYVVASKQAGLSMSGPQWQVHTHAQQADGQLGGHVLASLQRVDGNDGGGQGALISHFIV